MHAVWRKLISLHLGWLAKVSLVSAEATVETGDFHFRDTLVKEQRNSMLELPLFNAR